MEIKRIISIGLKVLFLSIFCQKISSQEDFTIKKENYQKSILNVNPYNELLPFYSTSTLFLSSKLKMPSWQNIYYDVENPYTNVVGKSNVMQQWENGFIFGENTNVRLWGLFDNQTVKIGLIHRWENLLLETKISVNKFLMQDRIISQYGISGILTYGINENLSITAFGQYINNPFYYSMAAYPYISTSYYGAFVTFHSEKVDLGLGVKRTFDPFARQWVTDPIVMPGFKVGKTKIKIDFGPAIKKTFYNLKHNKGYNMQPVNLGPRPFR